MENQIIKPHSPKVNLLILVLMLSNFYNSNGFCENSNKAHEWRSNYTSVIESGGVFIAQKRTTYCGIPKTFLVDSSGNRLTRAYRDIGLFSNGLAEFVVAKDDSQPYGVHGYLNNKGSIVIDPIYKSASKFSNGRAWVIEPIKDHYALKYIDNTGKCVSQLPTYLFKNDFLIKNAIEAYSCGNESEETLFWHKNGNILNLSPKLNSYLEKEIKERIHLTVIHNNGLYGLINTLKILKMPVILEELDIAYDYSTNRLQRAKYDSQYGYLDRNTGDIAISFQFLDTKKPTLNRIWVKKGSKWGCISYNGELKIPYQYDEVQSFSEDNRASVGVNGRYGHIDTTGVIKTPLVYDFTSYFNDYIAVVRMDNKYGYIDTTGQLITEIKYHKAFPLKNGFGIAENKYFTYKIDTNGTRELINISINLKALLIVLLLLVILYGSGFVKRKML
ncbi:WG repeat-containing protein [Dyadobacter tibetensis]|uniref:WG repeat-containing protein n=1 Tax=Dyadobacter tibetensis TaxID=1211851 RepID=UPI0004B3778F|nr:WG repeat-containing protein [Dyadobacter tibetensis]